MKHATVRKTPQKPASFKPLSIAQEAALDLLLAGQNDRETSEAVGVDRMTVWSWRREHPLFMATLERRRAEIWGTACERLRSLISKAVENLAGQVEAGSVRASIELLKCVGLFGNGTMNAIGEQDPHKLLEDLADQRIRQEGISEDPTQAMLIDMTKNPLFLQRREEIKDELWAEYGEE
jgi:hypothetical protein